MKHDRSVAPGMSPIFGDDTVERWCARERLRRIADGIEEPESVKRNEDAAAPENTGEGTLFDLRRPLPK